MWGRMTMYDEAQRGMGVYAGKNSLTIFLGIDVSPRRSLDP